MTPLREIQSYRPVRIEEEKVTAKELIESSVGLLAIVAFVMLIMSFAS